MKYVTTEKAVMNGYRYIIAVPYCDLQTLLKFREPVAYTSGTYGWNADIYEINPNTVIVTGYRPFGKSVPYEKVRAYERKAVTKKHELIASTLDINETLEAAENFFDELIAEFVDDVLAE